MAFSPVVLERFQKRRFQGLPEQPDAVGMAGSYQRGQFVVIGLACREGHIATAGFRSYNCLPAIAAADWLCETVAGATLEIARAIALDSVIQALGGLPISRHFCAQMGYDALQAAVTEAQRKELL